MTLSTNTVTRHFGVMGYAAFSSEKPWLFVEAEAV